ncbi:MAG: hypothetical protein AB8H79_03220 [Myxococcota bacterium]
MDRLSPAQSASTARPVASSLPGMSSGRSGAGLSSSVALPLDSDRFSNSASGWSVPWARLAPLWRHGVWLAALFTVLAVAVVIRLDVQRLQMDLDRNDRAQGRALVLHEQLSLEVDTRMRLQAVESWADQLGAQADIQVVDLRAAP